MKQKNFREKSRLFYMYRDVFLVIEIDFGSTVVVATINIVIDVLVTVETHGTLTRFR